MKKTTTHTIQQRAAASAATLVHACLDEAGTMAERGDLLDSANDTVLRLELARLILHAVAIERRREDALSLGAAVEAARP